MQIQLYYLKNIQITAFIIKTFNYYYFIENFCLLKYLSRSIEERITRGIEISQRISVNSKPKNDASNNVIGILTIAEAPIKVNITLKRAPLWYKAEETGKATISPPAIVPAKIIAQR